MVALGAASPLAATKEKLEKKLRRALKDAEIFGYDERCKKIRQQLRDVYLKLIFEEYQYVSDNDLEQQVER